MDINGLLELDNLAKEEGKKYSKRRQPYYDSIAHTAGKHFTGIIGPRGVGKTVLLKQLAGDTKDSFYISIDTLGDTDLFDIVKKLTEKYGTSYLLLDEIHFRNNFEGDLKKIFDFLNVKLVFTSSVALAIIESSHDLSRRVNLLKLYPFSFREYISFTKNIHLAALTIEDIIEKKWTTDHLKYSYLFEDYLKGGLHPFAIEEMDILPLLKNILVKIINKDIPSVARLNTDELHLIEKTVEFIGKSPVDGINYTSVSKNIGITKYKAEQYIGLLTKAFVLNPIFPAGTNVLKEPKVLMCLPYRLLYRSYDDAKGEIREDFFVEALCLKNKSFYYLKSTRGSKTPDFMVKENGNEIIIEVGGKGKGRQQFKGIESGEKIRLVHSDDTEGDKRPLFLIGFVD